MQECVADVMREGGVDEATAKRIVERVVTKGQRNRAKGIKDPMEKAAEELAEGEFSLARQRKVNALNAKLKLINNRRRILSVEGEGEVKGKGVAANLLQLLTTVLGKEDIGVENAYLSAYDRLASPLQAMLRKLRLNRLAQSKDETVFRDIARGLWNVAYGASEKVSASGRKTAEVMAAPLAKLRDQLNRQGAHVEDILAFLRNAEHDSELLITGGRKSQREVTPKNIDEAFEQWYAFVKDRLDPRMFDDLTEVLSDDGALLYTRDQQIKAYLRQLFNIKALHKGPITAALGPLPTPTGDIPTRLNTTDVIKWRNADAWVDYMLRYSRARNAMSMVDWALFHGSRVTALMDKFGYNPRQGFDNLIKTTSQTLAETDAAAAYTFDRELQGGFVGKRLMPDYELVFGHLDGSADTPIKGLWLTMSRTLQPLAVAAYLGNVFNDVASLLSIWPRTARLTLGENSIVAMAKALRAVIPKDKNDPAFAEVLGEMGAFADAQRRMLYDAFPHGISVPGTATYLARRLMRWSGMDYVADAARRAMREMVAEKFGRFANLEFDELNKFMRNTLETYGITADDWNKLRTGKIYEFNGRRYMLPTSTTDEAVQQKFAVMLHATARHSIVEPGVRERATLSGGRPGTMPAFFMSNIMMFKSWGLAAVHQSLGREIFANAGSRAGGVMALIMLTMLSGYVNLAIRSILTGYHVPEPQSPEEAVRLALKSIAMGGGLGLLGDLLFGQVGQQVNSQYSIGGPVVGSMAELTEIAARWVNSVGGNKPYDPWPALAKLAERNVPFHNLIWTRGAMNYLFWFHVQEALNPGWWERSNRDLKRRTGHARYGYYPGMRGTPYLPGEGPGVPLFPGDR